MWRTPQTQHALGNRHSHDINQDTSHEAISHPPCGDGEFLLPDYQAAEQPLTSSRSTMSRGFTQAFAIPS
jgi:hypothetical protein